MVSIQLAGEDVPSLFPGPLPPLGKPLSPILIGTNFFVDFAKAINSPASVWFNQNLKRLRPSQVVISCATVESIANSFEKLRIDKKFDDQHAKLESLLSDLIRLFADNSSVLPLDLQIIQYANFALSQKLAYVHYRTKMEMDLQKTEKQVLSTAIKGVLGGPTYHLLDYPQASYESLTPYGLLLWPWW